MSVGHGAHSRAAFFMRGVSGEVRDSERGGGLLMVHDDTHADVPFLGAHFRLIGGIRIA